MVYVFFAEGTEELEFISIVDALRRAAIEVRTVSIDPDAKSVTGAHGVAIVPDMTVADIDDDGCDMLILPGGMPGTTNLMGSAALNSLIDEFIDEDRPLAAICAAPMALAARGALTGKKATIFPGREQALKDGGAIPVNERVVVDGNVITGKGPGAALEFALAVIGLLRGKEKAEEIKAQMLIK